MYSRKITDIRNDLDGCSYIYDVQEQIKLEGPRFANIRSKLRRFDKQNNWTYEEVTKDNIHECLRINEQWYEDHEKTTEVEQEQLFLKKTFELYDEFDFQGGLLRVDGEPVAFNFGMPFNDDIYIDLLAKARKEYQYASLFMIHEFIKRTCSQYAFFNFAEDMGSPGLRKFKTELHPAFMTSFYYVTIDQDK